MQRKIELRHCCPSSWSLCFTIDIQPDHYPIGACNLSIAARGSNRLRFTTGRCADCPCEIVDSKSDCVAFHLNMAAKAKGVIEAHQKSFRRAVEAGVKVAMGTDSGVGRHGENGRELQLMVENGMTPMQAIVASTANAAQLLHLDGMVGTLEEGKVADVIVVDGEVSSDIRRIADPANVKLVLKGGRAAKNTLEARVPMLAGLV